MTGRNACVFLGAAVIPLAFWLFTCEPERYLPDDELRSLIGGSPFDGQCIALQCAGSPEQECGEPGDCVLGAPCSNPSEFTLGYPAEKCEQGQTNYDCNVDHVGTGPRLDLKCTSLYICVCRPTATGGRYCRPELPDPPCRTIKANVYKNRCAGEEAPDGWEGPCS